MIFHLYEEEGEYANKNLLDAEINYDDGKTIECRIRFGKDYKKTFGDNGMVKRYENANKPVGKIDIYEDNSPIEDLLINEDSDIFDKNNFDEYDPKSVYYPIASDTPRRYRYRLAGFYVDVKKHLETQKEKEYFRGIGHSILCWIFSATKTGKGMEKQNIFTLEASGSSGDQEGLVRYYKKLGFKTCADLSTATSEWYHSSSASGVCMYSTVENLLKICSLNKRTFKSSVVSFVTEKEHKTFCKQGYEINPLSGRCVKICKEGYNRNPSTGRCKKVTRVSNVSNVSKPKESKICKSDQEISLLSGRCVKKCKSTQNRNPLTGRCKKIQR